MAFELVESTKSSRRWSQDNGDGTKSGIVTTVMGAMNYESVIDSGNNDTPVDMTMTRVTNAQLDGYRCSNAGWHYAVQTEPASGSQSPQGTVGFGGRQGQNWFRFRLTNVGYLHWPTRTLDDIGGAPDYSAAPTITARQRNLNKHAALPDDIQTHKSRLQWGNIWTTPNGGELSIEWILMGGKLKENIRINQAGREWIEANRPAATPANETYFGFRFEIDASDIPRAYKNGILQDFNGDFDDGDGNIEFADASDRLLAFMPLDYVWATGRGGKRPLRKRIYRQSGQTYLVVGVRLDDYAGLLSGDLIFDPQMTQEVIAATADDCIEIDGTNDTTPSFSEIIFIGQVSNVVYNGGWRFTPNIPQGATITGGSNYARLRLYANDYSSSTRFNGPTVSFTVYGDDQDNAGQWADGTGAERPTGSGFTNTTASAAFDVVADPGSGNEFVDNIGSGPMYISSIVEEIVGRGGWSANNGMRFAAIENVPNGRYIGPEDYDGIVGPAALDVYYTAAGGGANPKGPLGMPLHGPLAGPVA